MTHRRAAWIVIAGAMVLDQLLGLGFAVAQPLPLWHAEFCALANAVTDGGDVAPANGLAYGFTAAEYILVVPLFAAAFSLVTSWLSSIHISRSEDRIKAHIHQHVSPPGDC